MSNTIAHEVLASIALFVGMAQCAFRWKWARYMPRQYDTMAMRAWACSTMFTALVIAYAMYESGPYPLDKFFVLACGVIAFKAFAFIISVKALYDHIEYDSHPVGPVL